MVGAWKTFGWTASVGDQIQGGREMAPRNLGVARVTAALLTVISVGGTAFAQKPGGVLRLYHFDSPASLSLHEEVTFAALGPAMGLFNNLVMFDQHVAQASFNSIAPDLATEWSWDSSKTELRFSLHDGVKWHDGKPFTANDVKCTWDTLLGKSNDKLRPNPRKAWYQNLEEVTVNTDHEVTFRLKRPQPSFMGRWAGAGGPCTPGRCGAAGAEPRRAAPPRQNWPSAWRRKGPG